ncbi:MAG: hypothetical protein AAB075_05350, partial [Gemmatimonadota bacterium]
MFVFKVEHIMQLKIIITMFFLSIILSCQRSLDIDEELAKYETHGLQFKMTAREKDEGILLHWDFFKNNQEIKKFYPIKIFRKEKTEQNLENNTTFFLIYKSSSDSNNKTNEWTDTSVDHSKAYFYTMLLEASSVDKELVIPKSDLEIYPIVLSGDDNPCTRLQCIGKTSDTCANKKPIGEKCGGQCNTAVYQCNDNKTDTICFVPLELKPKRGSPCGKCNSGNYECNNDNSDIICNDPLSTEPNIGENCGDCNSGKYICNDDNSKVVCDD